MEAGHASVMQNDFESIPIANDIDLTEQRAVDKVRDMAFAN